MNGSLSVPEFSECLITSAFGGLRRGLFFNDVFSFLLEKCTCLGIT